MKYEIFYGEPGKSPVLGKAGLYQVGDSFEGYYPPGGCGQVTRVAAPNERQLEQAAAQWRGMPERFKGSPVTVCP